MFYVIDENHNLHEAYDKQDVLAVIEQAIADGSLSGLTADAAFISKIRCCVSGETNKLAFVTQAKYNELVAAGTVEEGVYYFITDETTLEDIMALIDGILKGDTAVGLANNASKINGLPLLRSGNVLKIGDDIISVKRKVYEGKSASLEKNSTLALDFGSAEIPDDAILEIEYSLDTDGVERQYHKARGEGAWLAGYPSGMQSHVFVYLERSEKRLRVGALTDNVEDLRIYTVWWIVE